MRRVWTRTAALALAVLAMPAVTWAAEAVQACCRCCCPPGGCP